MATPCKPMSDEYDCNFKNIAATTPRDLILIANDRLKIQLVTLVSEFHKLILSQYSEIAGTTNTALAIRHWLPKVKELGHGPINGDRVAFDYYCERRALGREVHLFVFFDYEIEKHQTFKEYLAASLLQIDACWFPTPATARAYLIAQYSGYENAAMNKLPQMKA